MENPSNINIPINCLVYNFYYFICNTNKDIKLCAHDLYLEIPSGMIKDKIYEKLKYLIILWK